MAESDPLIGQELGNYRITDLIGRGGMGDVYRARDENLQRDIALKILQVDRISDLREVERFKREADLAAQLDHPNIVTVYGAGGERGFLYLAMELIEGESLRALIRRQKSGLPIEHASGIAHQVLEALKAAHESGIIHRDIKPENILLKEDGMVKVLDFGVAKLEGSTILTRTDEILGTVEYMAPEQILGEGVGPSVDLYATGAVLYEMLTGILPFSGESPATLVYHQLNEEPRAPSFLNPDVPRPLDRFVLRLLDKLAENRYGSTQETLEALGEVRYRQQLADIPRSAGDTEDEEAELRTRKFRPRFTGRHFEFGALTAHFDTLSEEGRVVFVAGEAGIGKTRMVEELGTYVEQRGGRAVQGICFFEHGMGPYMPFLDAIGNLFNKEENGLTTEEREELRQLLGQQAPELAELAARSSTTAKIRAGFGAAFAAEAHPDAARQRLFDLVFDLFFTAAAKHPLVIFLEDMHWADAGSLQLLQYLVHRAAEAQVLWVVTYRPEETGEEKSEDPAITQVLHRLHAEGALHEVQLQRLEPEAHRSLVNSLFLEADFNENFADFLYEQSQGNPFIAIEVLKLLRHQEILYCNSGIWSVRADLSSTVVPDRVNALIMRRVNQLDTDHRELLQMAAVIGQQFTSDILETASGMSRIALLKALFRLEKRNQLIISTNSGYEFSHSKVREVLYGEISWELRREYHRIVAAILEESQGQNQGGPNEGLAFHLYQAGEFARAVPHLLREGEQTFKLFGWRQAALLFDQAADACRQSAASLDFLLIALQYSGLSYSYLTAHDRALERFEQMSAVARDAERPEDEAEAWKLIGKVHEELRHFADATSACEKALACLGTGGGAVHQGPGVDKLGLYRF